MNNKEAVEEYQCTGCINGPFETCFKKNKLSQSCESHISGTTFMPIGKVFLGMPKGFNHIGNCEMIINIFNSFEEFLKSGFKIDSLNVPVWKFLDDNGNTLVRGLSPRINSPFLYVILGNHINKIDCIEITKEFLEGIN